MHEIAIHHDELTLDHSHRARALKALACGVLTGLSVGIHFLRRKRRAGSPNVAVMAAHLGSNTRS